MIHVSYIASDTEFSTTDLITYTVQVPFAVLRALTTLPIYSYYISSILCLIFETLWSETSHHMSQYYVRHYIGSHT